MCGIAGFVGKGVLSDMLASIRHRGPDQQGQWEGRNCSLGCVRLAVIDVEGGRQPILNEDESAVIVFNGEIFNYPELREELKSKHKFKTGTDTEVILHAYEEWGRSCVERFNGMFAFAIWDGKKLFMARDRMGEKPFYYHHGKKGFFFAGEIKAILTQIEGKPLQTPEFVAFEYPAAPDTYYENIKSLEPGCFMEYDPAADKIETARYWDIPSGDGAPRRKDGDYVEELRALLKDAVAIRLRSDVPVGIFLSGGMDSALIGALAGPMEAFTCRFPEGQDFDEWEYAEQAAKNIGIEPRVVTPTFEDFRRDFPSIIWHLDGPISTLSSIGEFSLAKIAKGRVKVVLGGQGADELFGGYIRYLIMMAEEKMAGQAPLKQYVPLARKLWGPDFGADPALRYFQLMNRSADPPEEAMDRVKKLFAMQDGLLNQMAFTDIHIQLPALLTMNDRAAAAYGLENRCPFLDHRIVEFAFRLPQDLRIREWRTKWLLRETARGLIPDAIVDRVDKKGLVTPVGKWLCGPLAGWVEKQLGKDAAKCRPGPLGVFDRSLYHALSVKIWEQVRLMPQPPGQNE